MIVAASTYNNVWAPSMYFTILYTRDRGKTWLKRDGNLKNMTTALGMSLSAVKLRR